MPLCLTHTDTWRHTFQIFRSLNTAVSYADGNVTSHGPIISVPGCCCLMHVEGWHHTVPIFWSLNTAVSHVDGNVTSHSPNISVPGCCCLMHTKAWRHTVPIFRSLNTAVSHANRSLTSRSTCSLWCARYIGALPAPCHTDDMNELSREYNEYESKLQITSDDCLSYGVSFWLQYSLIYPSSPSCSSLSCKHTSHTVVIHLLSQPYGNISSSFIYSLPSG